VHAPQRLYLSIDVQHLRLQKTGTITRYNPPAHNTAPSLASDARLVHPQIAAEALSSKSIIRIANPCFKSSIPSPLAAEVGITWSFGNLSCSTFRFSSHRASPFCWQPQTRRATTGSDRTDQFPGADSANLRPDCVPRFRRHPPRKPKRGSAQCDAEIHDPTRVRGALLRSNQEYPRPWRVGNLEIQ